MNHLLPQWDTSHETSTCLICFPLITCREPPSASSAGAQVPTLHAISLSYPFLCTVNAALWMDSLPHHTIRFDHLSFNKQTKQNRDLLLTPHHPVTHRWKLSHFLDPLRRVVSLASCLFPAQHNSTSSLLSLLLSRKRRPTISVLINPEECFFSSSPLTEHQFSVKCACCVPSQYMVCKYYILWYESQLPGLLGSMPRVSSIGFRYENLHL